MHDVIVVGGSFAGQSAAMQLARARQRVLLIDAGQPRNRFAEAAHGFLGQDGRSPAAIMRDASKQLLAYPAAEIVRGKIATVERGQGRFTVMGEDGERFAARRLILATGVSDELPPIAGLRERWGETVLHCPYCHGYEVCDQNLGIIANNPFSAHQAAMIPDWGKATYFTQDLYEPDADEAALLARRGVAIERTPVVELLGDAPALRAVRLADGRTVEVAAIFTAPVTRQSSPLAAQLGCAMEDGPSGPFIKVDQWGKTSIDGVFAAGDAAAPMHNGTMASAAGVLAGVAAHQSLFM
ncbi:NAD(P)/FAD-dependent oxidoreductase [Stakelama sp. CBK3Z-3]|uniref:Thioredoxin reductase n=1 Tax=Stakelama flava TaxID=2860338 RepID=A0ABS6XQ41_9SPHN|nr:NAD(P)/FAD-dependent oxidoreductase [Stakelama flava]MBW4331999.1 NAD(P)/FAD-dependent oxidoreductase [Stakelama flava]